MSCSLDRYESWKLPSRSLRRASLAIHTYKLLRIVHYSECDDTTTIVSHKNNCNSTVIIRTTCTCLHERRSEGHSAVVTLTLADRNAWIIQTSDVEAWAIIVGCFMEVWVTTALPIWWLEYTAHFNNNLWSQQNWACVSSDSIANGWIVYIRRTLCLN